MKIILSAVLALFLLGCSDDATTNKAKKEITKQVQETTDGVAQSTEAVTKKAKEATAVVTEQVKAMSQETAKKVKETSEKVTKEVIQTTNKVVKSSAEVVQKVAKDVEKKAKTIAAPEKPALDGGKLFTACAGCHGSHAERKAMGKSQVIKGWSKEKVSTALHGYKDGSYGGAMKSIMKGQASKLSDDEINAIGDYISKQ